MLEGGDEGQADRLPGHGQLLGVALGGQDPVVGDRRDPEVLGQLRADVPVGGVGRAHVHRPGPALAAPEHVEADVGGDPVQPGPHRRAALEAVGVLPGPDDRLLDGIVGLEGRPQHPVAVAGQRPAVLLELLQPGVVGPGDQTSGDLRADSHGRTAYRHAHPPTASVRYGHGRCEEPDSAQSSRCAGCACPGRM